MFGACVTVFVGARTTAGSLLEPRSLVSTHQMTARTVRPAPEKSHSLFLATHSDITLALYTSVSASRSLLIPPPGATSFAFEAVKKPGWMRGESCGALNL